MGIRSYFVYILASPSQTLYVGVTNDLRRRTSQHKDGLTPGFTSRYHVSKLVYYEEFDDVRDAIAREADQGDAARSEDETRGVYESAVDRSER